MHRIFALCLVLSLVFSTGQLSYAQTAEESTVTPVVAPTPINAPSTSSPLSCFDYFRFGSVQVDLKPSVEQTVPGVTLSFAGEVVNGNPYPLNNGTLFVKIYKRDATVAAAGDGDPVVDQFVIKEGLTLQANGSLPITFEWKVPLNAEGGQYYAAYFFATEKRYNLLGLSYSDTVVGNQAQFKITSESTVVPTKISKLATTLNGLDYEFAGTPLHVGPGDTVLVETTVTNSSDKSKTLPLQWNQYAWDALNKDNLRSTKTEVVTVAPGETKKISYTTKPQPESIVYVVATMQDVQAKSIINIRYVRDGVEESRISFPGITSFPLQKDSATTLFACAESTNVAVVPGNILTLTLTDRNGKVIHEYRYEGDITDGVGGYGEQFTPDTNINYALLTATLERNGVIVEQVKTVYDCEAIDSSTCLLEQGREVGLGWFKINNWVALILAGVGLLLLVAIVFSLRRRRANNSKGDGPRMTTPMS